MIHFYTNLICILLVIVIILLIVKVTHDSSYNSSYDNFVGNPVQHDTIINDLATNKDVINNIQLLQD